MKKHFIVVAVLAAIFILSGQTYADRQEKVNIVYPIDGISYPITDLDPGKHRYANFTASFSVTCQGDHKVEWGFKGDDGSQTVGGASFIDQISVQFVHQLNRGDYGFWVKSDCDEKFVKFKIGQ